MKPAIWVIKFQKQHPDDQNRQGYLHTNRNSASEGFLRGSGMDVGHFLLIYTKNGSKAWVGWLTEKFPNDGDGEGWYFSVLNTKNNPSADEGLEEVLVTVVNPCDPAQPSDQFTATVNPDVVP